jgi:hypothetical protein
MHAAAIDHPIDRHCVPVLARLWRLPVAMVAIPVAGSDVSGATTTNHSPSNGCLAGRCPRLID